MTNIFPRLFAFALVTTPTVLFAAPVSLDCYLISSKDGVRDAFEIQLNEEAESASYVLESGKVVRWRALFTPSKVVFGDGAFTIDRATLDFSRRNLFFDMDLGTDYGKCSVITAKRAF